MIRTIARATMAVLLVGGVLGVAPGASADRPAADATAAPVLVRAWDSAGSGAGGNDVTDTGNNRVQQFGPGDSGAPDLAVAIGGDLYGIQADGTAEVRLTSTAATDSYPDWSPDGSRIAFTRMDASYDFDLFVMDADGSNVSRVTSGAPDDMHPAWSPDGSRLAFTRSVSNSTRIFTIDADGSNLTQLTTATGTTGDQYPTWSPDGSKIAFMRGNSTRTSIYVMGADGSNPTRRTPTTGMFSDAIAAEPDWSPDGTEIAFSLIAFRGTDTIDESIYTVHPSGTGLHRIYEGSRQVFHPSWSPDGSQLVFARAFEAGSYELGLVNADGSGAAFLYHQLGEDPDWNPTVGVEPISACGAYVVTVDTGSGESATSEDDVIAGTAGTDVVDSLGGWDVVCGLGGNDTLLGGTGYDVLKGAGGTDTLAGGSGDDRLAGGQGTDTCRGGTGRDSATSCEITSGIP